MAKKLNYGIDAPGVIRNLFIIGMVLLAVSFLLPEKIFPPFGDIVKTSAFFPAVCLIIAGLLMILYAKSGKFRQRDRIINLHSWKGDEMVLDVGTGLGLLMIGAAKELTTGKSYGIDIFNSYDLSGNTPERTRLNTELEQVSQKTIILKENILQATFPDHTFDVVVSNLCLHNIDNKEDRKQACKEIYRIMKPEAQAVISDFKFTGEYKKVFESLGMKVEKKGPYYFDTFPPLTIIAAMK